ncbi:Sodium-dependent dicarboxylate transporter SdcS [Seminavis robusta]|uniref:Sodium-dependent dicarboxylate transporter SdcS n=1 Tax=Seminavis robusta TaxID=568900 RepID=A0A9N8DES3_9STRA|nr:Sodium-dependent dicarboxylate transporter SdcS [Seminavis robusta]|eukprot:Sro55_g032330.1 Sodium-dependent dicarboxylate transporter SdcS (597) ;mRNA; f:74802-76683
MAEPTFISNEEPKDLEADARDSIEATDTYEYNKDSSEDVEETASAENHEFNRGDGLKADGDLAIEEYEANQHKCFKVKAFFCIVGMIVGVVFCFYELGDDRKVNQTLAIAIWMATLWLTEAIPLVVTAFLPIVLFPLFGIVSSKAITAQYANNTIFLFISGFLMALTLQRWNLHRRFSLKLLTWCGVRPQLLLLGIMGGTFFLSMFVSNTATSLMMVPNALSICRSVEESTPNHRGNQESRRFSTAIFLGIAYAANVGGMASLLGTPPNLVFQKQLALIFPEAPEMTFATWLGFGLPISLIMSFFIWAYLSVMYLRNLDMGSVDRDLFKNQYEALGPWTREQVIVATLFTLEALLWVFRKDLEFENATIKGWSNLFPEPSAIADATVGMGIAILLFIWPGDGKNMAGDAPGYESEDVTPGDRTTLLDWKTANTMPYDIVFLFGGGFALAKAFVESGLSAFLGEELKGFDSLSTPGLVFVVVFIIIWLTELTSNTATSNIMIPIAASLAIALETNPYTLMIPVTFACSCAFALPIATPPNMVVFSTGRVPLREMNKGGLVLNMISSVVLLMGAFTFIPWVLKEDATSFPEWAKTTAL